jgi:mannosyltransferase OCH1-like enzyme
MIPKIIYQCGKWEENTIPDYVQEYKESFIYHNPDWRYEYFDDEMCRKDIKKIAGANTALLYDRIKRGDNRADFWRCIHLNKHGGFYADLDSICVNKITRFYDDSKMFVGFQNTYPQPTGLIWENWFFGASPNNPILETAINEMICRISDEKSETVHWTHTFVPFSLSVDCFVKEKWFCDITNNYHKLVGHLAAHAIWDSVEEWQCADSVLKPSTGRS